MSWLERSVAALDRWCGNYGNFVNQLGGLTLQMLAIATVMLGLYFFSWSGVLAEGSDTYNVINCLAFIYLVSIGLYIRYVRSTEPTPPAPINFPNLRRFLRSAIYVASLAFFFALDEPVKSLRNIYIPFICVCAYFHILVVLVILRRKNDYGVSDGFIAAVFSLLYPMSVTYQRKVGLCLVTFLLFGIRNLQFQNLTPQNPIGQNPIDQLAVNMGEMSLDS